MVSKVLDTGHMRKVMGPSFSIFIKGYPWYKFHLHIICVDPPNFVYFLKQANLSPPAESGDSVIINMIYGCKKRSGITNQNERVVVSPLYSSSRFIIYFSSNFFLLYSGSPSSESSHFICIHNASYKTPMMNFLCYEMFVVVSVYYGH